MATHAAVKGAELGLEVELLPSWLLPGHRPRTDVASASADPAFRRAVRIRRRPARRSIALDEVERSGGQTAALTALREELGDAREAAARVRHIVRDMKILSRGEHDSRVPVDVHHVLDSSVRMAWNEIRHRARLVREYGTLVSAGVIRAQPSVKELKQIGLMLTALSAAAAITLVR